MKKKEASKTRFIFLGFAAALLFVFALVTSLNKELAESIILYSTALILFVFAAVRFVPLMRHLSDKRRLILNAIEIFSNVLIGIAMIFIAMKTNGNDFLISLYCYLLSLVLFARGVIFITEGMYCEGEKEVIKYIVHLVFIVVSTVIVTLKFDITQLRWLIVAIALLAGSYCTADAFISFNRYRKLYVKKEKNTSIKDEVVEEKELPIMDKAEEREEVYVN